MKPLLKLIRAYIGQPVWVDAGGHLLKGRRKTDVVSYQTSDGKEKNVTVEKLMTVMPRKTIFER